MATADLVKALRWAAENIGAVGETIAVITDAVSDGIDKVVETLEDTADDLEDTDPGPVEEEPTPEQMYEYISNPSTNRFYFMWNHEPMKMILLDDVVRLRLVYDMARMGDA